MVNVDCFAIISPDDFTKGVDSLMDNKLEKLLNRVQKEN